MSKSRRNKVSKIQSRAEDAKLLGIGAWLQTSKGGIVHDRRAYEAGVSKKLKNAGLIMPFPYGNGFCFCPFVHKTFEFDTVVPPRFRSAQAAWSWLKEHAVGWKDRRYTFFNGLIKPLSKPIFKLMFILRDWICADYRFQMVVLQLLFSAFILFSIFLPGHIVLTVFGFLCLIGLLGLAVINIVGLWLYPPGRN